MASTSNYSKNAREERERLLKLKHKYENRITIAKYGKEALDSGDYATALRKFTEYLSIMAEIKEIKDIYNLKVQMFDSKKDVTEMLMISHILFEMARLYDAVPKFKDDVQKCLDLFVHFSANQPYQVINSEMVRKSLKRSSFKNPDIFRDSFQQIHVQSKKCYIVTFCYGDSHQITQDYREFKDWLLSHSFGQILVQRYYQFSSVAVQKYDGNVFFRYLSKVFIKPALHLFSKTLLPVIIKKC